MFCVIKYIFNQYYTSYFIDIERYRNEGKPAGAGRKQVRGAGRVEGLRGQLSYLEESGGAVLGGQGSSRRNVFVGVGRKQDQQGASQGVRASARRTRVR